MQWVREYNLEKYWHRRCVSADPDWWIGLHYISYIGGYSVTM